MGRRVHIMGRIRIRIRMFLPLTPVFLFKQCTMGPSRLFLNGLFASMLGSFFFWPPYYFAAPAELAEGLESERLSHVRVVLRMRDPAEDMQLRSLLYALRAQAEREPWLRLDFVLVPTQAPAVQHLREVQEGERLCALAACVDRRRDGGYRDSEPGWGGGGLTCQSPF